MSDNNGSAKLAFFLAGVGVGAVLALLFAPKSGKETREFIARTTSRGREYVSAKSKELRSQAEEVVDQGKGFVTKQKERLADALKAS